MIANLGRRLLRKTHTPYFIKSLQTHQDAPKKPFNMIKYLQSKMKFTGPLTVYEYMNESLTNPLGGYYLVKDAYASKKDFITSPDISQMFGELIGVWVYYEWKKMGAPKPLQLVELGPGNGSMMADVLRVLRKFSNLDDVEIHLMEKSEELSRIQEETICGSAHDSPEDSFAGDKLSYRVRKTPEGIPIYWSMHLSLIPEKFSIIFANEFLDALPMHKIVRTEDGWREMLVDIDDHQPDSFRYVISREGTPVSMAFGKEDEKRKYLEVSPESVLILKDICNRLHSQGGAALLIDYGHDGEEGDTFRAFKDHKQVNPLLNPGTRDLTYDIDFSLIRSQCEEKLLCFGPVTQNFFLSNMGIGYRLQQLLSKCPDETSKKFLLENYKMLMEADKMGERFKVISLYPKVMDEILQKYPPVGFHKIVQE